MVTIEEMKKTKAEYAKSQRCGIHFISASVLIWTFILIVNLAPLSQYYQNMLSLYSSAVLVPLALLFSKIYHIKFSDKENPLNTAGIVFALNQILYLLIVILVWLVRPDKMLMAYAIVVGAHFLPYSWLYDSTVYRVFAIFIPIVAFILGIYAPVFSLPIMMIVAELVMIVLFIKKTK